MEYPQLSKSMVTNSVKRIRTDYKRVKANKGASGVDGMTVNEALPWLKEQRNELLESIRNGKYKPSPVRRVEIPKDNGGVRKLGIPTVIDRIIQQAIAQVLIPIYEPKFSHGSYGYRPHRSILFCSSARSASVLSFSTTICKASITVLPVT